MRALTLLLLLLCLPLAAQTPLSPVETGPAYGLQVVEGIGSNGDLYLVVWRDGRGIAGWSYRASRITPQGILLDPQGIVLAGDDFGTRSRFVRVDRRGSDFVVVYDLFEQRIAADGELLDPRPVPVPPPPPPFRDPRASGRMVHASNGELHIGRETSSDTSRLIVFRTDAAGQLLAEPTSFPQGGIYRGMLLELVWTGSEYVLLWARQSELVAQRLDRNGALIGNPVVVATDLGLTRLYSVIALDGDLLISYPRQDGGSVVRLSGGKPGPKTNGPIYIATNGVAVVAAWDVAGGIAVSSLPNVDATAAEMTISAIAQKSLNADRNAGAHLLVWYEEDGRALGRMMARRTGGVPFAPWPTEGDQRSPAVARAGGTHMLAWFEDDVAKAMLFDLFDDPLLLDPLTLGPASDIADDPLFLRGTNADAPPAVAWSGQYFLVAWPHGKSIRLARITAGGVLLEVVDIVTDTATLSKPLLVRGERTFHLIWQRGEAPYCPFPCIVVPSTLHALRLDITGRPIGSAIDVATEAFSTQPDASWNGNTVTVAFSRDGRIYSRDVRGFETTLEGAGTRPTILGDLVRFEEVRKDRFRPMLFRDPSGVQLGYEKREPAGGVPRIYLEPVAP